MNVRGSVEIVRLKDLAMSGDLEFSDGYRTRSDQLSSSGVPILRVAEVQDGWITPSHADFVSLDFRDKMGRKTSQTGDVLVTTKGTVGRVARVPEWLDVHVYSPQLCYLRVLSGDRIDPNWLYYFARSPLFQEQVRRFSGQTDMAPYLSLTDLREFQVALPPLEEQRRIAGVLQALDDLIDVNVGFMDATFQLSRLLLTQALRDGCDWVPLSEVASVNATRVSRPRSETVRFLAIADVGDGTIAWPSPINWPDAPAAARLLAEEGDIIWSRVRPNRRSHALITKQDIRTVVTTGMVVLRPTHVSSAYLMAVTDAHKFSDELTLLADGTAYPTVSPEIFENIMVPCLPEAARQSFDEVMTPFWGAFGARQDEVAQLTSTRNELLPLLLSGRVSVREGAA